MNNSRGNRSSPSICQTNCRSNQNHRFLGDREGRMRFYHRTPVGYSCPTTNWTTGDFNGATTRLAGGSTYFSSSGSYPSRGCVHNYVAVASDFSASSGSRGDSYTAVVSNDHLANGASSSFVGHCYGVNHQTFTAAFCGPSGGRVHRAFYTCSKCVLESSRFWWTSFKSGSGRANTRVASH